MHAGDVIYDVYAQTAPIYDGELLEDKLMKIGEITMLSDFVTSEWADKVLYFQHRQITRDRKFWPKEWKDFNEDPFFDNSVEENRFGRETPYWPKDAEEAEALYDDQVKTWGCPFEWLMPANWRSAWEDSQN